MKVSGYFTNLLTHDLDKTKSFYELLGFERVLQQSSEDSEAFLLTENTYLLFLTEKKFEKFHQRPVTSFQVGNQIISFLIKEMKEMHLMEERLKTNHIEFGVFDDDVVYFIHLKDPNGYLIEFVFEK
ncbi:VOC family protein [Acholeplasma hippikon]|nr:VOC family protein [Acholeplasma hippikon]